MTVTVFQSFNVVLSLEPDPETRSQAATSELSNLPLTSLTQPIDLPTTFNLELSSKSTPQTNGPQSNDINND